MASNVIEAFFTASQNIDVELEKAEQALNDLNSNLGELQRDMAQSAGWTDNAEESLNDFSESVSITKENVDGLETRLNSVERALLEMSSSGEVTDREIQILGNTMTETAAQIERTENSLAELEREMVSTAANANIGDESIESLARTMRQMKLATQAADSGISQLQRSAISLYGAMVTAESGADGLAGQVKGLAVSSVGAVTPLQALRTSVDTAGDKMRNAAIDAQVLSSELGLLGAVSNVTAFEMGNLSINIGPFNVALQNLLVQLPAIITGMGTLLAIVTSLATAFLTLGAALGAFVVGGALAFFEEFSKQFEETGEAVEALMGALKDLFVSALEPLMTEANLDLFIDAIEGAANVVNRFAQFFQQMRGDIMGFLSGVGGDMDSFFEALHDSFIIVAPVLQDFINFFIEDMPGILVRFAELTKTMSGDVSRLINVFGKLINQLLDFASVASSGVVPVIVLVIEMLTQLFILLNAIDSGVLSMAITLAALGIIAGKVGVAIAGFGASIKWATLATIEFVTWQNTLTGTIIATMGAVRASIGVWATQTAAKLHNATLTNFLTAAMVRQLGIISALAAGNITLSKAILLSAKSSMMFVKAAIASTVALLKQVPSMIAAAGAASIYTIAATAAAGATWALNAAIAVLTSPITLAIAGLVALIAILGKIAGFSPFDAIVEGLKDASKLLDKVISKMNILPGLGGKGLGDADKLDKDDISTNPNVDLSFKDSIEQNVDVQADPEEKEQMKRLVKDAMNEANSIARRQDGVGQ